MTRWSEQHMREYEELAQFDENAQDLAIPQLNSVSIPNIEGVQTFHHIARLRHLAFRESVRDLPIKGHLFDLVDTYAVPEPPVISEDTLKQPLSDFSEDTTDFETNAFYIHARKGHRRFRTSLSLYPVPNVDLGIQEGILGDLLNRMFSVTPIDFATAGIVDSPYEDCPAHDLGHVEMPVSYIDPTHPLVYDINGAPWAFDAELHCIRATYTHLREIRFRMTLRNGRVNRAHIILFAALRLSCILEALNPLSASHIDSHNFNIRGFLLAILNSALQHIRIFKLLLEFIPSGEEALACDHITSIGVLVWCNSSGNRISVSTNKNSLDELIIKAILEGADSLDTSNCWEELNVLPYGHNEVLIEIFLSAINRAHFGPANKSDECIDALHATIALGQNSPFGKVRKSLVCRNNGLKVGIDVLLKRTGIDAVAKRFAMFGSEYENVIRADIENISKMSEFGVLGDDAEKLDMTEEGSSSDFDCNNLYTLRLPTESTIELRRDEKVVGRLSVTEGKFSMSTTAEVGLGVMPIVQRRKGTGKMDFGRMVEFYETDCDATIVANACLSNVFGVSAAFFVLNHVSYGDVAISDSMAPEYLGEARRSEDGEKLFSFLHPDVACRLGIFEAMVGKESVMSFHGAKLADKYDTECVLVSLGKEWIN